MTETKKEWNPQLTFWKAFQGKGTGCVMNFDAERQAYFVRLMPEKGERQFSREDALNVALSLVDVGEVLTVLNGSVEGLGKKNEKGQYGGLYHEGANGRSSIGFARTEKGYRLSIYRQPTEGAARNLAIGLTIAEGEQFRLFLMNPTHPIFRDNFSQRMENKSASPKKRGRPTKNSPTTDETMTAGADIPF